MPPQPATVYWDDSLNGPAVNPDPIFVPSSAGATVIQWTCGTGVANFQISGLDPTQFTMPATTNPVTVFTTTDRNTAAGIYNYTVTATHTSGRAEAHDPRIQNGSGID